MEFVHAPRDEVRREGRGTVLIDVTGQLDHHRRDVGGKVERGLARIPAIVRVATGVAEVEDVAGCASGICRIETPDQGAMCSRRPTGG